MRRYDWIVGYLIRKSILSDDAPPYRIAVASVDDRLQRPRPLEDTR